jgi:hypothetical protein
MPSKLSPPPFESEKRLRPESREDDPVRRERTITLGFSLEIGMNIFLKICTQRITFSL